MLKNFRPISRNSLGEQVMLLLSFALFFTLITFSLSVFYFVNRAESAAWQGRQSEAASNAAATVSGFIQRAGDALLIVGNVELGSLVSSSDGLNALILKNTSLLEIVRIDSSGQIIASASRDRSVLANLITIPQSQWFLQARQGQTVLGGVQLSANNEPYLIMAVPSSDKGVVAARVQMNVLWDVVKNIHFGKSGEVAVITHSGRIIAHTDAEFAASGQTLFGRPELSAMLDAPNHKWTGDYTNFHNERVVAATVSVPGTDWIVITELPKSEAFASSRIAILVLSIEALLLLLTVRLIADRYVRLLIVNPMGQLRDGVDRIGQGNLDHRIALNRKDEIGQLASAFNSMAADLEKQQGSLHKAIAYEYESQRARELDILLKASEATSSSLDFDTVMHTLAEQLLEISGFESCFIGELDKETNTVVCRLDHSRIFWRMEKRESYSMRDYPRSNQVLLTGNPIILQGDFEAEEKKWMEEMSRTAVIILALFSRETVIGLVEIASIEKNKLFDPSVLENCRKILSDAAAWVLDPLPANEPKKILEVERALLQATGASVCTFSEWDRPHECILTTAVVSNTSWEESQGPRFNPNLDIWKDALFQGKTSVIENSDGSINHSSVIDNSLPTAAESLIVFPLQKGDRFIGVIELCNFNYKTEVSPEQITLLRTIADKASYSIENARLLQLTQKKLDEQIILLNEKEVLLKEIHHRVKNNLQIISSLLNLQSNRITDASTLQVLGDSQARIRSMALIHEKLYQSQSLEMIDFGEYVQNLASDLFRTYQHNIKGIQLNVQADEVALGIDQAVSCGLILNELITNSLKYGFPDGREGTLWIELRSSPERVLSLRVADNGVGIPADFDILNTKSLGLQLVNSLVGQLDGKMELDHSEGTEIRVSFTY